MSCDYPEIIDETLKNKFSNIQKLNGIVISKSRDCSQTTNDNLNKNSASIKINYYTYRTIFRFNNDVKIIFCEEFCNYYFNEGVEKIFILDDKSNNIDIYDNIKNDPRVFIYYAKNNSSSRWKLFKTDGNRVLQMKFIKI